MSYPPDPNNPYGQQPPQAPQQPGYGYPQQGAPQQPGYGYPQQGAPAPGYGAPQGAPGYGAPQPGYGYPQQGAPAPGTIQANNGFINIANLGPVKIATMGQRFLARLLDGLIIGLVMTLAMVLGLGGAIGLVNNTKDCTSLVNDSVAYQSCLNDQISQASGGIMAGLFTSLAVIAAIGVLYEWLMVGLVGATLGKMALGLRVVKESTGENPGLGGGFIRYIIPTVGGFLCGIGQILVYLSPFFDNSGKLQGWHDRAAGTVVVKKQA
ncbi:RDD family protein [Kitasatospora sp. NPDC002227]|uniref:RDD family protein n=1 Tax=Kitasatospora sp. NPDC002227 TaxID=3154773 RepID=UPI00332F1D35